MARTPRPRATNIPVPRNRFFGRVAELDAISRGLEEGSGGRLITILGPPGVGKSRLAIEWALRRESVVHVDLVSVDDAEGITNAVAAALGVSEGALSSPHDAIAARLQAGATLVLDPFDHLVPHARQTVGRWLGESPAARIIVVSTTALHLEGERRVLVEPLPPEDAAALFHERLSALSIASSGANTGAIERILSELDGLPLAIALAAGRARVLSLTELADELGRSQRVLRSRRGDVSDRHASMRAAVEWAEALLPEDARQALAHLSVFAGSFDRHAAAAAMDVAAGSEEVVLELLELLVDRSLVATQAGEGPRRFRLYAPVRAQVRERLGTDEETTALCRIAAHYAERFDQAPDDLLGRGHGPGFAKDMANVLAIGAVADTLDAATATRLFVSLRGWFRTRVGVGEGGHLGAYLSRFEGAIERLGSEGGGEEVALTLRARTVLASFWARVGRTDAASEALVAVVDTTRGQDELRPILAEAMNELGIVRWSQGRHLEAEQAWAGVAALGVSRSTVSATTNLALLALEREDPEGARAHLESLLPIALDDPLGPKVELLLGWAHVFAGEAADATLAFDAVARVTENVHTLGRCHMTRGIHGLALGDTAGARQAFADALQVIGADEPFMRSALQAVVGVAAAMDGDLDEALRAYESSLARRPPPSDATWSANDARALLAEADRFLAKRLGLPPPKPPPGPTRQFLPDRYLRLILSRHAGVDVGRSPTIAVDRRGRSFRIGDAAAVNLRRMPLLSRLLAALAENLEAGSTPIHSRDLVTRGWPGESILPDAAATRLYQAIKRLRSLGIGDAILSGDGGYRLDDELCVLSEDEADTPAPDMS